MHDNIVKTMACMSDIKISINNIGTIPNNIIGPTAPNVSAIDANISSNIWPAVTVKHSLKVSIIGRKINTISSMHARNGDIYNGIPGIKKC